MPILMSHTQKSICLLTPGWDAVKPKLSSVGLPWKNMMHYFSFLHFLSKESEASLFHTLVSQAPPKP